jgi:hypothetical protein
MQRGGKWQDAVFIGALLAMIGGVRQQSTPALLPLVLFSCWRFKEARLAKLGVTATVTIGFGLLWFVPMVWMCGGMGTYLEIVRLHAQFNAPATVWGGGIEAFLNNVAGVTGFCWNGLVLAAGVLGAALLYRAFGMTAQRKRQWDEKHASALMVLAIWIAPMVAVGTVIGFTKQPGYVLSYLPGWFVLTGAAVASLKGGFRKAVVISAVCAVNVVAFIAWPLQWNGVFFGARLTAHEIKDHDTRLSQMISEIRRRWRPNEVVICHADEFYLYGLKHFQLCLPEYDNYQLATDSTVPHPAGKPLWRTRDSHLEFVNGVNLDGTKGLVLLVPPDEGTDIFAPYFPVKEAIHVGDGESGLFFLPAEKLEQ